MNLKIRLWLDLAGQGIGLLFLGLSLVLWNKLFWLGMGLLLLWQWGNGWHLMRRYFLEDRRVLIYFGISYVFLSGLYLLFGGFLSEKDVLFFIFYKIIPGIIVASYLLRTIFDIKILNKRKRSFWDL